MTELPKIYVSYAWKDENEQGENRELVVDEIQQAVVSAGYKFIRDKNELKYGQSIKQFMQDIGQADFIVLVLSNKYLKSMYCMYEVMEIMRHRDYSKKVLPIILGDANIFERKAIQKYLKFWIAEYEELKKDIEDLGQNVPKSYFEDRDFFELLIRNIDEFARSIADINSFNPQLLCENNYKDIIALIKDRTGNFNRKKQDDAKKVNLESKMNYSKINKIDVDGDGNIILQDVSGQNITINYNDTEAFTELIQQITEKQSFELKEMLAKQHKQVLEEISKIQLTIDKDNIEQEIAAISPDIDDFLAEMKEKDRNSKKELIYVNYKLLRDNEKDLILESDSRRKLAYEHEIERIKSDIARLTEELKNI